ncbi:MAG TPA: aminotransferase class I/II-fold pyridoxal phosphate-dependent enzyme [Cyclobacteriaceae bacterium]|nr:aminotransferase class I/II-fold pyridoxal phosphate-dependent enzyme [Cyclobacteriaceae bacterium]
MSKTRNSNKFINTIDECLTNGVKNGIFQVSLEDDSFNGREVTIAGQRVVNFGSCSYLGLEVDERLKEGAIDATRRFGTQYSSSRLFSACNLYEELEDLFYKIFDNNPALLAATTTLTHMAALPILVQDDDLVILDHQVHGSVQLAAQLLKARGTKVEMIKHNRMDMLEDLIKENPNKYNKIWYMADGLYSMYGDYAPLKEITYLMEKYPTFHFYVDDAHGMSWAGKNGSGYVLSQVPLHPKMVLTTSLAKGFGTGGGVMVLSDKEMMRKITTCGSSYTYSGPVQPPMLGASIASAKIHLTEEIYELQGALATKLELARSTIERYDLPHVIPSNSPIYYIGLGLPRVGYNMVRRLLNEGFYTNIGIFPGVPVKCCGLRLAVTNGQTEEDIKNVLDAFRYHFPKVLEEEGQTIEDISANFNLPFEKTSKRYPTSLKEISNDTLAIQHETTIHKIDKALWDDLLGDNGTFDWEGCRFLEETFCGNPEPENNWKFHYLIIRDENKKPVLATFFTELLCKDDMISTADVSRQIEEIRKKDKYYLTSKVIMMGSLLSEGNHLYVDRTVPHWKHAMLEMVRIMNEEKQKCGAAMVQLRDLDSGDDEMREFLITEGFIRVDMPDTHVIENLTWNTPEELLQTLSHKTRYYVRKNVIKPESNFQITYHNVNSDVDEKTIQHWYDLYLNVKKQSFNLNTFDLPLKLFKNINKHRGWETIEIKFNEDLDTKNKTERRSLAMVFCYNSSKKNYCPMIIGIDYTFNNEYSIYRQALYQMIKQGRINNNKRIYIGMDASVEKQKLGAKKIPKSVYVQAEDNFNMELISLIKS